MAITIKPVRGEIEPQSIGSRSTTTFLDSAKSNAIDFNKTQRIVSNEMIRIKNHNEKMELQRIKNKTTKYDSLMSIDVTNFNQKLKEGDKNGDAFDKETLDNLVDKFGVDMVKKYKNGIFKDDERSWGVFESYFYTNLNKAYDGANTVTNQKILADSAMSWSIHKTKQKTEISDQKAGDAMWIAMEAIIAKEKEEYSIAHNAGNTNIDIGANLESIRREFWIKAVTGGHEKELENGEKGIDWDSVLANLNKETEWYGKKLTDKDKRWLVDYAEGEMRQQNFTENTYITNYNRNLFNDNIDKVLTGEFKISDIKGLKFKGGEEGFKLSQGMIGIAEKVQLGEMGNESNIDNFLELREMLLSGKLTSLTEKITLQTDEDNTEPRSILERVGTDISDTDFGRLLTLYNNKDNKMKVKRIISKNTSTVNTKTSKNISPISELPVWTSTDFADVVVKEHQESYGATRKTELEVTSPLEYEKIDKYKKGKIVHTLLQFLPDLPPNKREKTAKKYLEQRVLSLDKKARDDLLRKTLEVINHPDLSFAFDQTAIAEAPIYGTVKNIGVTAQIDRLLVKEDRVIIIDYKSNVEIPQNPLRVPKMYLIIFVESLQTYFAARPHLPPQVEIKAFSQEGGS